MNRLLPLLFVIFCVNAGFAQHGKPTPNFKNSNNPGAKVLNWPGKSNIPPAANPFKLESKKLTPQSALVPIQPNANKSLKVTTGENGLPIMIEGRTGISGNESDSRPISERAIEYVTSLEPAALVNPADEFVVTKVQSDEQGNQHVRLEQQFEGIPVWGTEVIAHPRNGEFAFLNGRYFPSPKLTNLTPALDKEQTFTVVRNEIGFDKVKSNWSQKELELIDGSPFSADLVVFHVKESLTDERLAWHVTAHPNVLSRLVYFVDAMTGEILDSYDNTCNFVGLPHTAEHHGTSDEDACLHSNDAANHQAELGGNAATISGLDLFNINRSFPNGGWQDGSIFYMENSTKSMYNAGQSNMPSNPVGVIVGLDGLFTSPENNNFDYEISHATSSTFTNQKAAISAHYNAGLCFDYYKSKHNRNAIDGIGGNIISFVNINESDGSSMENAFWNGAAMWYGNGASIFQPLARGLDVGGHEMTHGVVEKTANLVYQGESGALNESFADVFGAMIDSDDWKIGEDVVKPGVSPNGCLRDLSNPHNGAANSSSPWWQPNHVNEQYTGSQDNGGVHINSGIPNHAFYLFANDASVGKTKAEQVYYKALRDYLVKSSKFVDCRLAVIQAATDLYGASVANVAANAFAAVGIGGSAPSGNYLGQLNPNPGQDFVLCVSNDLSKLDLATGAGAVLGSLYSQGVQSRPSITDSGLDLVFVNNAGHIIGISLDYSQPTIMFSTTQLSDFAEWRQAAISKDGRFIAALTDSPEPYIYVFDLFFGNSGHFKLYNPTYSQGQITGDVQYADVLEFDYSGEYVMYDAYNELTNNQGQDLSYWDIGFLQFWDNNQFTDENNAFISKLFSGIPTNTSIGDPAFSKNSPYILAFDFIDETGVSPRFDIYGANSETGDYDVILSNNGAQGWPTYNRLDNKMMYETNPASGIYNLRLQGVNSTKIQPSGGSSAFISNHSWGVWYGNGLRSLMVDSKEPGKSPLQLSVAPNPVRDYTQISLNVEDASEAQVSVCNLFGQVLLTREFSLQQGDNVLDYDMSTLPAGSYVIRVSAGNAVAAVKVIKG